MRSSSGGWDLPFTGSGTETTTNGGEGLPLRLRSTHQMVDFCFTTKSLLGIVQTLRSKKNWIFRRHLSPRKHATVVNTSMCYVIFEWPLTKKLFDFQVIFMFDKVYCNYQLKSWLIRHWTFFYGLLNYGLQNRGTPTSFFEIWGYLNFLNRIQR